MTATRIVPLAQTFDLDDDGHAVDAHPFHLRCAPPGAEPLAGSSPFVDGAQCEACGLPLDEPPVPSIPWADILVVAMRVVIVVAVLAATFAIGWLFGVHRGGQLIDEELRTRRAMCQLLDELGADASTAEQAEPCRDTPAGS